MHPTFRDRFLTPRVARAITSPSAILVAGAGASLGILAGLPAAGAAVCGAAAYAARVALAVPRQPRERVDLRSLREPWRRFVREALDARQHYERAVTSAPLGPLRERLAAIGERLDDGVRECWRIASRGQALEDALAELDPPERIRGELEQVSRDRGRAGASTRLDATEQALRAQLASSERITAIAADTRDRLRLLDARLDEAVARAVELTLRAGDTTDLGGLGSDVDALVGEMEALRQALEETSGPAQPQTWPQTGPQTGPPRPGTSL